MSYTTTAMLMLYYVGLRYTRPKIFWKYSLFYGNQYSYPLYAYTIRRFRIICRINTVVNASSVIRASMTRLRTIRKFIMLRKTPRYVNNVMWKKKEGGKLVITKHRKPVSQLILLSRIASKMCSYSILRLTSSSH